MRLENSNSDTHPLRTKQRQNNHAQYREAFTQAPLYRLLERERARLNVLSMFVDINPLKKLNRNEYRLLVWIVATIILIENLF
jgi:hypothetical protein